MVAQWLRFWKKKYGPYNGKIMNFPSMEPVLIITVIRYQFTFFIGVKTSTMMGF